MRPTFQYIAEKKSSHASLPQGHGFSDKSKKNSPLAQTTKEFALLQVLMIGVIGVLLVMPKQWSGWDVNTLKKKPIDQRWIENISSGPVIDKDKFIVNYLGHPLSGATYYVWGRSNGFSRSKAFVLSFAMSTFWEYGWEAFFEIPSIQDLIITPTIGSLIGEVFFNSYRYILNNNGKLLGSVFLGDVSLVLLNPIKTLNNGIAHVAKKIDKNAKVDLNLEVTKVIKNNQATPYNSFDNSPYGQTKYLSDYLGLNLLITY